MTERARAEACRRVGEDGHDVASVAAEYGVGWAPTVVAVPPRRRARPSPTRAQKASRCACAWVGLSPSGRVRHQRCARLWLPFSTTPLRLPRRAGQMSTPTE